MGTNEDACEGCCEPLTGRADRRFCSNACRQAAYRTRRRHERAWRQMTKLFAKSEQFMGERPHVGDIPCHCHICAPRSRNAPGAPSRNGRP